MSIGAGAVLSSLALVFFDTPFFPACGLEGSGGLWAPQHEEGEGLQGGCLGGGEQGGIG